MKKLFFILSAALTLGAFSSNAHATTASTAAQINQAILLAQMDSVSAQDLSNWHVGDNASYNLSLGGFMKGTLEKRVSKDEGSSLWVRQDVVLPIQKDVLEMQIDKATGKTLKLIHNGKEEQIPDDKLEIISQDATQITVPAGTYKAIHVVAKSAQIKKLEAWINPHDTVMEGTLKQVAATSTGIDVTMELTKFSRS